MRTLIVLVALGLVGCNSDGGSAAVSSGSSFSATQSNNSNNNSGSTTYTHFAYVTGLGHTDQVHQYGIDPQTYQLNSLNPDFVSPSVGIGSCAMAMDATKTYLYVTNCRSNTVSQYKIDTLTGQLSKLSTFSIGINITGAVPMEIGGDNAGNIYVTVYKTTNNYIIADYLVKYTINASTGQLAYSSVVTSNISGQDYVGNYLSAHPSIIMSHIIGSAQTSAALDDRTFVIQPGSDNIDQYENGVRTSYTTIISTPQMIIVR